MNAKTKRRGNILYKRFYAYLVPAIITSAALSLNEFVDSIVVAKVMDAHAMAVVSLSTSIVYLITAVCVLLGAGGQQLYAKYAGNNEGKKADAVFWGSLIASAVFAILLFAVGTVFRYPIACLLSGEEAYIPDLTVYLGAFFLSVIPLLILDALLYYLPVFDYPGYATALNVVANVVNLIFDYIYMGPLQMGVAGAAYATFTGYVVAILALAVLMLLQKIKLPDFVMPEWKLLLLTGRQGMSQCAAFAGSGLIAACIYNLASEYGGYNGVIVYSLTEQIHSILSIVLSGILDSSVPIFAYLNGQKDNEGIRMMAKRTLAFAMINSLVVIVIVEACPQIVTAMFSVTDPAAVAEAKLCLRIYMLQYLAWTPLITYREIINALGQNRLSTAISLMMNLAVYFLMNVLLAKLIGFQGLFWAGTATYAAVLLIALVYQLLHEKKSSGLLSRILSLQEDGESVPICNITIEDDLHRIAEVSEQIEEELLALGMSRSIANRTALLFEEMTVYTKNSAGRADDIDVMISATEEEVRLNFRSIGTPFNPTVMRGGADPISVLMLNEVAQSIRHTYVLGMNSTCVCAKR